jgi:hypothetical protein
LLRVLPKPRAFNRAANPGDGFRGCGGIAGEEEEMVVVVVEGEGVFIVGELSFVGIFGVELLERPAVQLLVSGVRAVVLCEPKGSWKSSSGTEVNVRTGS